MNTIRQCDKCGNEDSVDCVSGLCPSCENEAEINLLKEENEELRNSLDGYLPIANWENEHCWKLINQIIENEIQQEKDCNL